MPSAAADFNITLIAQTCGLKSEVIYEKTE